MGELFRGWRRKVGGVTLVTALVILFVWPWAPTAPNGIPDAAGVFIVLSLTAFSVRMLLRKFPNTPNISI